MISSWVNSLESHLVFGQLGREGVEEAGDPGGDGDHDRTRRQQRQLGRCPAMHEIEHGQGGDDGDEAGEQKRGNERSGRMQIRDHQHEGTGDQQKACRGAEFDVGCHRPFLTWVVVNFQVVEMRNHYRRLGVPTRTLTLYPHSNDGTPDASHHLPAVLL